MHVAENSGGGGVGVVGTQWSVRILNEWMKQRRRTRWKDPPLPRHQSPQPPVLGTYVRPPFGYCEQKQDVLPGAGGQFSLRVLAGVDRGLSDDWRG